jgi:hypothetical protein
VWSVHARAEDGLARHYYRDVRVLYRTVVLGAPADESAARQAAETALFFIRRGFHYVPTAFTLGALLDFRHFRQLTPLPPSGVEQVRARAELSHSLSAA